MRAGYAAISDGQIVRSVDFSVVFISSSHYLSDTALDLRLVYQQCTE